MAQIALRNMGDCAWPSGLELQFVSGDPLSATEIIPLQALGSRESVQIQLAMTSGIELREYESRWEVRQTNGQSLGSAIFVRVTVGDVPAPEPLSDVPLVEALEASAVVVGEPLLAGHWTENVTTGIWQGTLTLTATGGTGDYRYYRGVVAETTWVPDGQLDFEGVRCADSPLVIWVLSGDDVVRWDGLIPYPDSAQCP